MSLVVRHLRLRASTARGLFGNDFSFGVGLNVLRAENSRGKSTAMRALVYALAMERMITTRPAQALTSAMRDALIYDAETKSETPVLSSWVDAELTFGEHTITVRRTVTGGELKPQLVRVWHGPALTTGEFSLDHEDYFVGGGNTTSLHGFHPLLAELLGWSDA